MSGQDSRAIGRAVRGTIRRRLLVNAVVDPDEAAARLPAELRPHVTELGTVVGCCLLEIEHIRPDRVPAAAGRRLRAAAHRISVEWDDRAGTTTVGVYVPVRDSDSRLAVALGGRWFPGTHRRASIDIAAPSGKLRWLVGDARGGSRYDIRVTASIPPGAPGSTTCEPIGGTCLGATIGLSPDRRGVLEGARMDTDHRLAREVTIEDLDSGFLAGFATAHPAPSYLMRDVDVTWTPAPALELAALARRAPA
jgi:hypothetical protein